MTLNELIILNNVLGKVKVGKLPNDILRKYLKLSLASNKQSTEFQQKRYDLATEAAKQKSYNMNELTAEQNSELISLIAPILTECLNENVDGVESRIFSWDLLCDSILNLPANEGILTTEEQALLTDILCEEKL